MTVIPAKYVFQSSDLQNNSMRNIVCCPKKWTAVCLVGNTFVNCLMFTDDMCGFDPSTSDPQHILNVCCNYATKHAIIANFWKTVSALFLVCFCCKLSFNLFIFSFSRPILSTNQLSPSVTILHDDERMQKLVVHGFSVCSFLVLSVRTN